MHRIIAAPAADGGNPRSEHDIVAGQNGIYIFPFSEDGDNNYKFHMNIRLENTSGTPVPVRFTVEWGDEEYQSGRGHLLICTDNDHWQYIDAEIEGTRVIGTGAVPPGVSFLSFHPRYEYGRMLRLAESLPEKRFNVKVIGQSRMRRDIIAIETGSEGLKPLTVYGRVHPYETVASYLMEGMLKWLAESGGDADGFLSGHRLIFVPMPNPDGVADGTNKRTHGGLDFSTNFKHSVEPEAMALKEYFSLVKPRVLLDLHGWNNGWDNINVSHGDMYRQVAARLLPDEDLFYKPMDITYKPRPMYGGHHSCGYFAETLGLSYLNSSWNHVGRTSAQLYAMGVKIMQAVAESADVVFGK